MQPRACPSPGAPMPADAVACTAASAGACTAGQAHAGTTARDAGKTFATLRARAALICCTLASVNGSTGLAGYLLARWVVVHALPDLAAVAALLCRLGAPE